MIIKGDKIEVLKCPPESFGYRDYIIEEGIFQWHEFPTPILCYINKDGEEVILNLNASSVVDVRKINHKDYLKRISEGEVNVTT